MLCHLRILLAALAVVGMLAVPATSALANSGVEMAEVSKSPPMVDLFLMRPLGLAGLAVSAAAWVPAELLTMAVRWNDRQKPVDYMLKGPVRFVFVDPLGEH